MDRRTILAITLTFGVYYAYLAYVTSNQPPVDPEALTEAPIDEVPVAAPAPAAPSAPASTSSLPVRDLAYEACDFTSVVSTAGGGMHDVVLPNDEAPLEIQTIWGKLLSFTPFYESYAGWSPYGQDPGPLTMAGPRGSIASAGTGAVEQVPRFAVEHEAPGQLVLRAVSDDGVAIRHTLTEVAETADLPCHVAVETTWSNPSSGASTPAWIGAHTEMEPGAGYYDNALRPYAVVDGGQDYEMDLGNVAEPRISEGPVNWFGVADRYFMAGLLPEEGSEGVLYFSQRGLDEQAIFGDHLVVTELAGGQSHTERLQLYIGGKASSDLDRLHPDLGVLHNYGWFALFANPLLSLLVFLQGFVHNWGLAIISLTVLVKGVLFPLTHMGFKSSQRMQSIQPLLGEIREKYAEEPEELNRRTMELFQKEGVNPLGGCLPMVLQMPVWFALYRVLLQAPQLYHTDFLYLKDLSSVDPYGALPLMVMGLMVLQQQFTPMGNLDPTQARVMKLMPVIFGFFFFTFPSGLVLYIFVNTMLSILQQWWIRRSMAPAATPTPQGAAT